MTDKQREKILLTDAEIIPVIELADERTYKNNGEMVTTFDVQPLLIAQARKIMAELDKARLTSLSKKLDIYHEYEKVIERLRGELDA
jgi:hypothetical protein